MMTIQEVTREVRAARPFPIDLYSRRLGRRYSVKGCGPENLAQRHLSFIPLSVRYGTQLESGFVIDPANPAEHAAFLLALDGRSFTWVGGVADKERIEGFRFSDDSLNVWPWTVRPKVRKAAAHYPAGTPLAIYVDWPNLIVKAIDKEN